MKIQKSKTFSKKLVIPIVLALLLLTGGTAVYFQLTKHDDSLSPVGQPAESDKKQAAELADNPNNKEKQVNTDVAPAVPADKEKKRTVSMVSSVNISDNKVYIRGGLNGAVVDKGRCYATLKNSTGASLQKDTTLLQNASTTDCKTIVINSSELAVGKWTVALTYSSDTMEGFSDEANFEIK